MVGQFYFTTPNPNPAANGRTSFGAEPKAPERCYPQYAIKSLECRVERAEYLRARSICVERAREVCRSLQIHGVVGERELD